MSGALDLDDAFKRFANDPQNVAKLSDGEIAGMRTVSAQASAMLGAVLHMLCGGDGGQATAAIERARALPRERLVRRIDSGMARFNEQKRPTPGQVAAMLVGLDTEQAWLALEEERRRSPLC